MFIFYFFTVVPVPERTTCMSLRVHIHCSSHCDLLCVIVVLFNIVQWPGADYLSPLPCLAVACCPGGPEAF